MPDMRDAMKSAGLSQSNPKQGGVAPGRSPHPGGSQQYSTRQGEGRPDGDSPFPEGYPEYLDADKHLKVEYLDSLAEKIAIAFGDARLTKVQLRHFYNYVRRRQAAIEAGRDDREVLNEIAQLKSIAHRQLERGAIPKCFASFIARNVDKSQSRDAFLKGFVKHFQAVLGFCEGRVKERG